MLDETRMRTACFAPAPQRCTSCLSKHFLLTFQEVTPLSKTRNQLLLRNNSLDLMGTHFGRIAYPLWDTECSQQPAGRGGDCGELTGAGRPSRRGGGHA